MSSIDRFLNTITMYRLTLYYLIVLLVVASLYGLLGIIPYSFFSILFSTIFLVGVCWVTNTIFAKTFHAQTNLESVYISALILALVITPASSLHELGLLFWAGVLAIASKYILAISKKHIFNPVALSLFVTSIALTQEAHWWVGTLPMLPFVLAGGALIVRKIRRSALVSSFLLTMLVCIVLTSIILNTDTFTTIQKALLYSPLIFFSVTMLTEPLTTPPTKKLQMFYGALVGVLFLPQIHIGSLYSTPELALVVGNVFSYLVSPKEKLSLTLKEKLQIAPDIYDFIFSSDPKPVFTPGQYLEWTLPQRRPDSRGSRRYFTIASSPTEKDIRIGLKFYPDASSFKQNLFDMKTGDTMSASQLAGDFVLSKKDRSYVFIAGGIGITPFRSILKNLIDTSEKRSITLFYMTKTESEIVYKDILNEASTQLDTKVIYTLTDPTQVPKNWHGKVGIVTPELIRAEVPDYKERYFYLSGPHAMVISFEDVLSQLGVPSSQIVTDYFPGFV